MAARHRSAADRPCRPSWSLRSFGGLALSSLLLSPVAAGYKLDTTSPDSIKSIASEMTKDMMSFYNGDKPGGTPGLLPSPYYWWEAGAMMGALIDYWYYTGDAQYNDIATEGLLFQTGPNADYMPPNQTLTEGNDDQGFWGMAVMTAAEYKFPDPPAGKPQWLALAQAVFNTQAVRWDTADCQGGLRWQIFTWNNGYDYKNTISQACFFNLAARLLLYTGNTTYGDWAVKTWDWMAAAKLMDAKYNFYDGAHIGDNCTSVTPYQWSYNAGAFLLGAAAMYNYTSDTGDQNAAALWKERVDGILNGTQVFFTTDDRNIMTEVACEPVNLCDLDQQSFKAFLSRWMAATTKWAPWTESSVMPLLEASSVAAAKQCTGGDNGQMCGLIWTNNGKWDNSTGMGQQMAAMEVTLANLITSAAAPVTNKTGGTSQGDANAGGSDIGRTDPHVYRPVKTGDRVGAGILTALVLAAVVSGVVYMLVDETVDQTPTERWTGFVAALGKNSKRLAKRSAGRGDASDGRGDGRALSEKGKQPRVASFGVLASTDSGGSVSSDAGSFQRHRNSVQSDADAGVVRDGGDAVANTDRAAHGSFFSPAHFRHHRAASGHSTGAPDPGHTTVIEYPAAVAASSDGRVGAAEEHDPSPAAPEPSKGTRRSFIKRKAAPP